MSEDKGLCPTCEKNNSSTVNLTDKSAPMKDINTFLNKEFHKGLGGGKEAKDWDVHLKEMKVKADLSKQAAGVLAVAQLRRHKRPVAVITVKVNATEKKPGKLFDATNMRLKFAPGAKPEDIVALDNLLSTSSSSFK